MSNKERYINIEFEKLYEMLIKSNEKITKELIGWNQEDYNFLVNILGLEKEYAVKLVKKINSKPNSQIKYYSRKRILNEITKKYLSNNNNEKILVEKMYYDYILKILK